MRGWGGGKVCYYFYSYDSYCALPFCDLAVLYSCLISCNRVVGVRVRVAAVPEIAAREVLGILVPSSIWVSLLWSFLSMPLLNKYLTHLPFSSFASAEATAQDDGSVKDELELGTIWMMGMRLIFVSSKFEAHHINLCSNALTTLVRHLNIALYRR